MLRQLTDLVKERHDAFARLKTLEDLMEALRAENEMLREGLASSSGIKETAQKSPTEDQGIVVSILTNDYINYVITGLTVSIISHCTNNRMLKYSKGIQCIFGNLE